jgi:hypothetical protein
MTFPIHTTLVAALVAPVAAMGQAQADHRGHRVTAPAFGPAAALSPPGNYRSVFDSYRRYTEQPVQPWREANDAVGRIGGWQAYAREGQGGPEAGSAPPGSAPASHDVMHGQQPPGSPAALAPAAGGPGPSPAPAKVSPPSNASPTPAAPASGAHSGGHSGHK